MFHNSLCWSRILLNQYDNSFYFFLKIQYRKIQTEAFSCGEINYGCRWHLYYVKEENNIFTHNSKNCGDKENSHLLIFWVYLAWDNSLGGPTWILDTLWIWDFVMKTRCYFLLCVYLFKMLTMTLSHQCIHLGRYTAIFPQIDADIPKTPRCHDFWQVLSNSQLWIDKYAICSTVSGKNTDEA